MPSILFNKPYGVICQFSSDGSHRTLADFIPVKNIYPAGRLDLDSEGLLLLTDDGRLQHRVSDPNHKMPKTYLVQVEHAPSQPEMARLRQGIALRDGLTGPAHARLVPEPYGLWPRVPAIRFRKHVPTAWIELILQEGRNRQVRRMTAAIGHPTLRLIRWRIGTWTLAELPSGQWRSIEVS